MEVTSTLNHRVTQGFMYIVCVQGNSVAIEEELDGVYYPVDGAQSLSAGRTYEVIFSSSYIRITAPEGTANVFIHKKHERG